MAYIVQSKDLLQVNRISEEEVEEIPQPFDTIPLFF